MFHHGLIYVESSYCHSKSDPPPPPHPLTPRRTTRHTHNLACDIPSHRTAYRQKTFFPRTIPEWNSLPQEVTTAPSQSGTVFPKKRPQHHPRVEQPSPRSDHSIIPEWNSLPQEVTTASSQSGTAFPKKWPQHPPLAPSRPGSAPY